ncbi:MAG: hypothetical protein K0Q99_1643 [Clostridia bacterium]|jgi:hypothetical protein|nr:hypothetical protein [Clostridia bacterium]
MSAEAYKESSIGLTSTEISNIWSAYMKNNMELRFFEYFIETTEDSEVRIVVESMLKHAQYAINELKSIFLKENIVIPLGFTKEDVKVNTPKVFSDIFTLFFCQDLSMLSMSTYPSAFSDCTRKDIRDYFQMNIDFSMKIQNEIVDLMLKKGVYLRPPQVDIENEVDLIDEKKYLRGLFGEIRPINMAEIANLSRIVHRAQFSKMVFVAFSKLAESKELTQHFSKGRDEIQKVLDSLREALEKENIPISASGDYKTIDVEVSPFSDKLMLFFVNACLGLFCFTMLCQAVTSSFRSDITAKVAIIMKDMKQYYGDSIKLSINEGWLEKPPQSKDRRV